MPAPGVTVIGCGYLGATHAACMAEPGVEDTMSFLRQVDDINLRQRTRVVRLATAMRGGNVARARIAVGGAAVKPHSDDVRDSPALSIAGATAPSAPSAGRG